MDNEILKQNIIKLVEQHKEDCHDPECGVSLYLVKALLDKANIDLTTDEKALFI